MSITAKSDENEEYNVDYFVEYLNESKNDLINKFNVDPLDQRFTQALEYNLLHGELLGLRLLIPCYKDLLQCEFLHKDNLKSIHIMGWCVELMIVTFILYDDITDNSTSRLGRPCWHRVNNIGLTAIHDGLIFENMIFYMLRKHFRHHECYVQLLEVFQEAILVTACGQNLDMLTCQMPVATFSWEFYQNLCAAKNAYACFYLSFVLTMHMAGIKNPQAFEEVKVIACKMGLLFQAQNDYLDCFGNPEKMDKFGNDIEQNKCTWLALECMERATEEQKHIMFECYGKKDPQMIQNVMELYKILDLPQIFADFEMESYENIKDLVEHASSGVPRNGILKTLERLRDHKLE
ncbi:uncharacterized protein LOC131996215 [Stomoxys calcitrans]|uniref:uncharacterized protein LOC131996215 n=1 Tax=Stomoxys calcitrans TaxID=35570 RepID=UPI0027E2B7AF|nr:uncharacterized protein LOC131996215 [Stomoxys calcitrans]